MSPWVVALIVALLMMAGALAGATLRKRVSSHHFDEETKDVVKLGLGFLATLSALVMGLIVSSSKASYDSMADTIHTGAALVVQLDTNLRLIGPEADPSRELLRQAVASTMDHLWRSPRPEANVPSQTSRNQVHQMQKMLVALPLHSDGQREARGNALRILEELARINAVALTERGNNVMPPLLVVVTCWMMLNVMGWNLFAPSNHTVSAVNLVCSLSVASAIFLILEMDQPFGGIIGVSDTPLRAALMKLAEAN